MISEESKNSFGDFKIRREKAGYLIYIQSYIPGTPSTFIAS